MLDRALLIDHASFYDPVIGNRAVYSRCWQQRGERIWNTIDLLYTSAAFPDDSQEIGRERRTNRLNLTIKIIHEKSFLPSIY